MSLLEATAPAGSSPRIGPHTSNGELKVYSGIGGGTALSMQRRAYDSRFATRYFVGNGLDVGGGHDSLALYTELFPLSATSSSTTRPRATRRSLRMSTMHRSTSCFRAIAWSICAIPWKRWATGSA